MSDERVDADAAADGNGTDDSQGGRTAVVTRPQRPTGKRSRQRADAGDATGAVELTDSDADDSDKAKKAKKAKKSDQPSNNPFVFVYTYLKQVVSELRKVIWPNRKQMSSYTSVVLAFLVFMVALIGLVDLGLAKLVMMVFG
ncbi:preprotein translocase subunit SecE [Mycobacterium sp. 1245111.1]|uniref:preprotein translocase subunit SecE n=1 Tax=Mycobacterium sp. 1245111.1 TaxID=1834073 RepID=UPI0007FDC8E0|nr:preprotein translocase subunit SecE [Mycobacterium sp. 1245111.1]OBK35685.1 preprotein translocase subunit SecE [Mycobacterium sp. 1245111.1]